MWRGLGGLVARTSVGSSVQLSTFSNTKDFLVQYEVFAGSIFLTAFGASMVSGFFTSVAMTPFDTVATRIFNQGESKIVSVRYVFDFLISIISGVNEKGKGLMYKNVIDCFIKTVRVEGFWALYKGFSANYMRIAPHTILNLTFWEHFKKWKNLYYDSDVYFE